MNPQFMPMSLGDIFEKTFSLVGRTFVRNLIIGVLFLLGPMILMAIAADIFYSSIGELQQAGFHGQGETGIDALLSMAGAVSFFGFATIVLVLCALFAEIAISIIVSQEILSHPISYGDAIDETFSHRWLSGIGQGLLKYSILIGGAVLLGILMAVLAAISKPLMSFVMILCLLVIFPMAIYLAIRWYFSLTAVAVDDMSATDSMRKSWNLVDGSWWRTFGILFLLSLLSQFIITIVSLPITFASMWDVYKEMFTLLGKTGGAIDPGTIQQIQKSAGPGVGISTGFSTLLSLLITPVFTVVMYYDLRARNNDFPRSKEFVSIDGQSQEPIDLDQL